MKRIAKHLGELLPPVRLYREDVEELYQAFSDAADKTVVSDADHVYDDLAELFKGETSDLKTFRIASDEPSVSFTIEDGGRPWLWARHDDPVSRGVFHLVREIAMRRRLRFYAWLMGSPVSALVSLGVFAVVAVASVLAVIAFRRNPLAIIAALVPTLVAWGIYLSLAWFATQGKPCRVVLVTRQQRPGFLARNRDALVVGSATAVVGAAVGALLTLAVIELLR